MKLTHVRLLTDDVARLVAFYRDLLGLEVTLDAGDGVYCELRAGNAILGVFRRDLMDQMIGSGLAPAGRSDAVALTFQVDDVDEAARAVRERGAELVSEPADYEVAFLRVAHLRDPDGNLVELNAPLRG
ncbi:MAG TPA: VOC family protein [Actinomycetota bacterium]|nr:VOC family protein [Actinomycetota bacterium]